MATLHYIPINIIYKNQFQVYHHKNKKRQCVAKTSAITEKISRRMFEPKFFQDTQQDYIYSIKQVTLETEIKNLIIIKQNCNSKEMVPKKANEHNTSKSCRHIL